MADTLVYLYGAVSASADTPSTGVEGVGKSAVWLLPAPPVAGVASEVAAAAFSTEALDRRTQELEWMAEQGAAHERVLLWFADRGPVVPFAPFSLHADRERARERLQSEGEGLARVLDRLAGKREWGVRLWRDDAVAKAGLGSTSGEVAALDREMEDAAPGRRFLLERKRSKLQERELGAATRELAEGVYAALSREAAGAARRAIPPLKKAGRRVVLDACFLVSEEGFEHFREKVGEERRRLRGRGFEVDFTGPWPPYHFAGQGD